MGHQEMSRGEQVMTTGRSLLILLMMVATGIAIVVIRGETAKASNRVQRLHQKQTELEHTLWSQEMDLARLRGPEEIRRRTKDLGLNLLPPRTDAAVKDANRGQPAPRD